MLKNDLIFLGRSAARLLTHKQDHALTGARSYSLDDGITKNWKLSTNI
jgi:hypothetical protein